MGSFWDHFGIIFFGLILESWDALGVPWAAFGGSRGVPWASLGCLKGSPEAPLKDTGGLLGVPRALLVALGGVFSFLGRSGSGFRENPGDSGSHFGFILDHFLVIFRLIFRLRFLIDF